MQKLITYSWGVDEILNLLGLDDWALVDAGFKCTITYYHMVEGREFGKENLPCSFRNMKLSLICHLNFENHQKKYVALKAMRNEERKVIKNGGKCGINCAGIAYNTLYFSESGKSYEHHIADAYDCGGLVGIKNHSARFP